VPGGGPQLRYRWQGGPHVYAVRVEIELERSFEIHEGSCIVRANKGNPPPAAAPQERKGTGTGFVVHSDGYLVTCAHVVADAVKVEVAIGGLTYPANVLAVDGDNDLAVVRINGRNLPTLALGNSDAAEVGMELRAFGFPLSSVLGDNLKVTRGTLSGLNKRNGRKVFQVDASINPGNSGGPLLAETGEVLGVASAKVAGIGIDNVGLVVPISEAKRLLTAKGVAFTNGGGGAKLDGPALVKRTSPAVALITVTIGQRAADDTYRLSCAGHLNKREKPKEGVNIFPGPPPFPRFNQPSQIDMDGGGRILQASGGTQLPVLLGEMGQFLIDPLPPDNRLNWQVAGTCTLESSSGVPRMPFGPRFGPRIGPFGPRGMRPGQGATTSRQATELSKFTRGATVGDTVTILKNYELKTDPTAVPGVNMSGDSKIAFDIKEGMPREIEFKGALVTTGNGGNRRRPFVATYKLLLGAERDRILNPPAPPKGAPPVIQPGAPPVAAEAQPLSDADLKPILAALQGADKTRRKAAVGELARAKPGARREEVAKALVALLTDPDMFTRKEVVQALGIWGTKDSVPSLLPLLEDTWVFTRWEAMTALGKLQDDRAAEPIAKRLATHQDRMHASKALQALGSKAEKAVIPYLKNEDWGIRLEACRILGAIGTKASKPALEAASKDSNGLVAGEAKRAIAAVSARP
jgi:hypothetical protein